MIVRSGKGYEVRSESGKRLSKRGMSKAAAEKRLAQIEYSKARDSKRSIGRRA